MRNNRLRIAQRWQNSGYTERENGASISVQAAEAEAAGKFSAGNFRKNYGVSVKSFDLLLLIGVIENTEWHHTGQNFRETEFYAWSDHKEYDYSNGVCERNSFGDLYFSNKKEIDALAKLYEIKKMQYELKQKTENIPTIEQFILADFQEDDWLTEEENKTKQLKHSFISADTDTPASTRYELHKEVDDDFVQLAKERCLSARRQEFVRKYNEQYGAAIARNAAIEISNNELKKSNLAKTDSAEQILLNILTFFDIDDAEAYEQVYSVSASTQANIALKQRKQQADEIAENYNTMIEVIKRRRSKWILQKIKDGTAERVFRISQKKPYMVEVVEEMNGKYGWFRANDTYRLPTYYSGIDLKTVRAFNHYQKYEEEILRLRLESYEKQRVIY